MTAVPEGARTTADTADAYAASEDVRRLLAAVGRLNGRDRAVVLDRALTGDSVAVLAARYGETEQAVRERLTRARRKLADPRKNALACHALLLRQRVTRWARTRRVDTILGPPTKGLSVAMSSVLVVTGVPASGALPAEPRPPLASGVEPVGPADPAVAPRGAGATAGGPRRWPVVRVVVADRQRDDGPHLSPAPRVRVTACVLTACASAGGSDPERPSTVPGDEVYVDLPPETGGRQGVTQNVVKVCDLFPNTRPPHPPVGCERHP